MIGRMVSRKTLKFNVTRGHKSIQSNGIKHGTIFISQQNLGNNNQAKIGS